MFTNEGDDMNSGHRGRHRAHDAHGLCTGHPSSFAMHDPEIVDLELALRPGDRFLDLGCGAGDYALRAATFVRESGSVLALDKTARALKDLEEEADRRGLGNITTIVSDFTASLPIPDDSVDVCLVATALHMVRLAEVGPELFADVHRVLRPGGRLVVIECKREETPCGPPLSMRSSPDDIEAIAMPCGFERAGLTDLGYTYLLRFNAT
jgi:SAM-dependent methyltransferase